VPVILLVAAQRQRVAAPPPPQYRDQWRRQPKFRRKKTRNGVFSSDSHVLEDRLSMAAHDERHGPDNHNQQHQHESIVAGTGPQFNSDGLWRETGILWPPNNKFVVVTKSGPGFPICLPRTREYYTRASRLQRVF
jgi:hypothetical protein